MRSKSLLYFTAILAAVLFLTGACSTGFVVGRIFDTPTAAVVLPDSRVETLPEQAEQVNPQATKTDPSQPSQEPPRQNSQDPNTATPRELRDLFDPFWQAWDIVHDQYVDQPVDDIVLMRGAIQGMLEALGDQHTGYMNPDQFMQANMDLSQEYEGIGAWVDPTAEYLTIISPMPDSPAEKAGLRSGDQVIAIDGEDMTGIDGNLVIRRVLGPAGSQVVLTIRREVEGGEPEVFDVEVTRARITLHSVTGEMLENDIAYIQIVNFAENTREELRNELEELLAQNPTGLIVDLRNNGGGYLRTAVEVTSEFIGEGVILYEEYGDGSRDTYEAISGGMALDIPMVVLINEGSASASEIMAGAIQDYERATLVGVTSFGKGSVQNWIPLENGQDGAVRVTIARWLTPDGRQIHEVGLTPDVEVPITDEDIEAERDPQLDKAIEILLSGQ